MTAMVNATATVTFTTVSAIKRFSDAGMRAAYSILFAVINPEKVFLSI